MTLLRTRKLIDLQAQPVSVNITFAVTVSAVIIILITLVFRNRLKFNSENELIDIKIMAPIKLNKYQKRSVRTFKRFFDSILPIEFKLSTLKLFVLKLKCEHELSSLRVKYIPDQNTPTTKWLQFSTKLLTFLLVNTALNIHLYGDYGQCGAKLTENDCSDSVLLPSITTSICKWDSINETCKYSLYDSKSPQQTLSAWFVNMMILVTVTLLVQAVLGRFMRLLITHSTLLLKQGICSCCFDESTVDPNYNTFEGAAQNDSSSGNRTQQIDGKKVNRKLPSNKVVPFHDFLSEEQKEAQTSDYGYRMEGGTLQDHNLEEFGDELKLVQTRKNTIIRAVCFYRMRHTIDYISPDQEVLLMLRNKVNKWSWIVLPTRTLQDNIGDNNVVNSWKYYLRAKYYRFYDIGDPDRCLRMVKHGHLFNHELLVDKVIRNRERAALIRAGVLRLKDSGEDVQDMYLMQQFIAQSLIGFKRKVIESLLFYTADIIADREHRLGVQCLAVLIIPLFYAVGLFYLAYYGVRMDNQSSTIWCVALVIAVTFDVFISQPVRVWIQHVWIPRLAMIEYTSLHTILSIRAHTILTRHSGILKNINCVIQHYHPACRAARLVPWLASSRILMSLTDYDLPVKQLMERQRPSFVARKIVRMETRSPLAKDFSDTVVYNFVTRCLIVQNAIGTVLSYCRGVIVYVLLCLPLWLQCVLIDSSVAIAGNSIVIGMYVLAVRVGVTAAIVLCGLIVVLAVLLVLRTMYCQSVEEKNAIQELATETTMPQHVGINSNAYGDVKLQSSNANVAVVQMTRTTTGTTAAASGGTNTSGTKKKKKKKRELAIAHGNGVVA